MADSIIKIEDFNPIGDKLKGTAQIPISQDKVDYRVSVGEIEQSVLSKVSDRYLEKDKKIPNENLTFGKVKEGDENVVSGGDVFNYLNTIKKCDINNVLIFEKTILDSEGLEIINQNYITTFPIFVNEADVFRIKCRFRGKERNLMYFFDSNLNLAGKALLVNQGVVDDTIVDVDQNIVIPKGVHSFRIISMSKENVNYKEDSFKVEFIKNLKDNVLKYIDVKKSDLELGSIDRNTGLETQSTNYYRTKEYLPCSLGDIINLSIRIQGSTLSFYDSNKNFIKNEINENVGNFIAEYVVNDDRYKFFKVITMSETNANYQPYDFYIKYYTKIVDDKNVISEKQKELDISSVALVHNNAVEYPSLKAVRLQQNENYDYIPYSWYYQSNKDFKKEKFYKSDSRPDNDFHFLFEWKKELTDNGDRSATDYNMVVLPNGDCLFVFRTEIHGDNNAVANDSVRSNPIVYPASNYNEPYVIDFGNNIKPTAWGCADGGVLIDGDVFYIAEYTRRVTSKGYLWRVEGDYNDVSNWSIVAEFDVSRDNLKFKHFHVVDKDPYSGNIYFTTGDYEAEIYVSNDNGRTFSLLFNKSEENCRLTSFVWLEDAVYWSTDAWDPALHKAFKCKRDVNGVLDPNKLEIIHDFSHLTFGAATYKTSYLRDINSLIFFNRYDADTDKPLEVWIYDLYKKKMLKVGDIQPFEISKFGFRCTHISVYQGNNFKGIMCGFDLYPNLMKVLNNKNNDLKKGLQNILVRVL